MHIVVHVFLWLVSKLLCRRARVIHHATLEDKRSSCGTVVISLTVPEQASPFVNYNFCSLAFDTL